MLLLTLHVRPLLYLIVNVRLWRNEGWFIMIFFCFSEGNTIVVSATIDKEGFPAYFYFDFAGF